MISVDGTSPELACDFSERLDAHFGIRLASIFVILLCSTFGALVPIFLKHSKWIHKCTMILEYAIVSSFTGLISLSVSSGILVQVSL